jgi:hypothetical protein
LFEIADKTVKYCRKYQIDRIRYLKINIPCYSDIPEDFPIRSGDNWTATIDIVTGIVRDWKQGVSGRVFSKVRDAGKYYLLNEDKELIFKQECGYVPNKLIPPATVTCLPTGST